MSCPHPSHLRRMFLKIPQIDSPLYLMRTKGPYRYKGAEKNSGFLKKNYKSEYHTSIGIWQYWIIPIFSIPKSEKCQLYTVLTKQCATGWVAGPFSLPNVFPKKAPGNYCSIHYHSFLKDLSINEVIPQEWGFMRYVSFDHVAGLIFWCFTTC